MSLHWERVRAFALVARHGSLSAAARAGGASQPTLGRQIGALERELGVTLFDRRASGLVPTPSALALLEHAETMANAADRLALAANGRSATVAGTVRITASEVVATWTLPPILTALRIEEPAIAVELVASNATGNLLQRDADIAVRMFRPTQNDVITRHLGDQPILAWASPDYLARRGVPGELDDLLRHDVIGYDLDAQLIAGFKGAGVAVDREFFPLRCDDHVVCWQLVLAGAGIGFMQEDIGHGESRVRPLFAGTPVTRLPMWLTARAELRTSARIRRVYDFLADGLSRTRV